MRLTVQRAMRHGVLGFTPITKHMTIDFTHGLGISISVVLIGSSGWVPTVVDIVCRTEGIFADNQHRRLRSDTPDSLNE